MDPNNKKDQKNNQNRNRNMRGVVTLIIWALVLTVVFNYINAYSNNLTKRASSHEIPYSQLIDLIQEDQVAELKIENGVLYATPVDGYVYTEEATDKNKEPKSYTQSEKTPLILYTTALNDASLLPLLEEHNVKYTSPVQTQMSPILEFMITYVLPVIVLAALFMLVMRIMAKNGGIGGIGSVAALGFTYVKLVEAGVISYGADRIRMWEDPWIDALDEGYQMCQSLIAIGSGGLTGVGLGKGRQKFLYLPEEHNDFIFAVVCEELGLIGAALVMLIFALLILRGFWVALQARDRFGALLVVGIMTQISLQTFLNIAVVSGLVPATGISLPFFSYGGTALALQLFEMGIVLSVSRQIPAPRGG